MTTILGTQGYAEAATSFISLNESISFNELHCSILDLVPSEPSRVLDIGSGSGRDAAALAQLGHSVVAVEPTHELIESAKQFHSPQCIEWFEDSLPGLTSISERAGEFDFILCHAVWQHLDQDVRLASLKTVTTLLSGKAIFALGLRHGPASLGSYHVDVDVERTIADASSVGLQLVRKLEKQPSVLPGKADVTWTRLVFKK